MDYKPLHKEDQLILGSGKVGIITGWTPREKVAKQVSPDDYAVIGNLYSPNRGIKFLLRNLIYNQRLNHLLILNALPQDKKSGSCQVLWDFFFSGMIEGENGFLINSNHPKPVNLSKEFEKDDLIKLRERMVVCHVQNRKDFLYSLHSLCESANRQTIPILKPYGNETPMKETPSKIIPSEVFGHRIVGESIADAWYQLIPRIRKHGVIRATHHGGQLQELIDLVVVIKNQKSEEVPDSIPLSKEDVAGYIHQMVEDQEYKEGVKYTYGQRIRSWFGNDQLEKVVEKLQGEIDSASAVISLWDSGGNRVGRNPGDSDHDHSGSPCLNHIWFRYIPEKGLTMTAIFRSNDMFSAWLANAYGLRKLQEIVGERIGMDLGELVIISESAHIYDDCFEEADKLASISNDSKFSDPVGNFLISWKNESVKIKQVSIDGEWVDDYSANLNTQYWKIHKPIKRVTDEIIKKNPTIQPSHIAYLTRELYRISVEKDGYRQD